MHTRTCFVLFFYSTKVSGGTKCVLRGFLKVCSESQFVLSVAVLNFRDLNIERSLVIHTFLFLTFFQSEGFYHSNERTMIRRGVEARLSNSSAHCNLAENQSLIFNE